jgi:hypothetical protein
MKNAGNAKLVKLFYFKASDISSDDVVFDTENEISQTPAQKKTAMLEMLRTGLLGDDNGVISLRTKGKILDILGYGSLDNAQDLASMHRSKAEKENIDMLNSEVLVEDNAVVVAGDFANLYEKHIKDAGGITAAKAMEAEKAKEATKAKEAEKAKEATTADYADEANSAIEASQAQFAHAANKATSIQLTKTDGSFEDYINLYFGSTQPSDDVPIGSIWIKTES